MKKIITLISIFIITSSNAQNPSFMWARNFGSLQSQAMNTVIDASGNIYTTGVFQGTGDFDSSASTFNLTAKNSDDYYITKYDNNGNFIWAKSFGSYIRKSTGHPPLALALDSSGNVYLTGGFRDTHDFDPGSGVNNLSSVRFGAFYYDSTFILKLDTNGDFVWAKNILGGGGNFGASIKIDSNNNILIGGICTNTTDLDPGVGTAIVATRSADNYILKLNTLGEYIWSKNWGGTGSTTTYGITVDSNNAIISTGVFKQARDFDPGSATFNLTSNGGDDIFISKLDTDGNFVWAKSIGGVDNDNIRGITADINNNLCLTGNFWGTVDFDTSSNAFNMTASSTTGISKDGFVLKLNLNGDLVWAKQIGAKNTIEEDSRAIAVDNSGNVFTTGYVQDKDYLGNDYDPSEGVYTLFCLNAGDPYFLKLDSNGNFIWAFNYYAGQYVYGNRQALSINVSNSGIVYSAGSFNCPSSNAPQDFDFTTGTSYLSCDSRSFLLKFNESTLGLENNQPSILSLFPNPTTSQINLSFNDNLEKANIKISSILGQTVLEKQNISGNNLSLDVSGLGTGTYIIQVKDGNSINSSKFIKK